MKGKGNQWEERRQWGKETEIRKYRVNIKVINMLPELWKGLSDILCDDPVKF